MTEGYRHYKVEEQHGVAFGSVEQKALAELDEPIAKILNQLRPTIEKGSYKIIVGDDSSGRIPTLIIARAIKKIYAEQGIPPPLVRFVAGSRLTGDVVHEKKEKLLDAYAIDMRQVLLKESEKTQTKKPRVLIVTDFIESGRSVKPLVDSFKKNGVGADLATIGIYDGFSSKKARVDVTAVGQNSVPNIYQKKELSGVIKSPKELFATRTHSDVEKQRKINATREIVIDIADRISKKFLSKSSWLS